MRAVPLLALLLLSPALLSAADPLTAARAEAAAAERERQRLESLVARAQSEAERLRAQQAAAAQGILAAEAALAEAEARAAALQRRLEHERARLDQGEQPAAILLAGLAQAGRNPPLLALADARSLDEIVHLRALIDTALPVVAARTAALRADLQRQQHLVTAAAAAARSARERRAELLNRQRRFAMLEARTSARLAELGEEALGAGDVALVRRSEADTLAGRAAARRLAERSAAELALLPSPPRRPLPPSGPPAEPLFAWQLPVNGPVLTGLSEVSASGVRSRGLTIGSAPAMPVHMPADGQVVFAAPFRRHASVVILDHGGGWMTLMTGVRSSHGPGTRLRRGEPLGRALGDVTVELSRDGRPQPAALIAGSSPLLSNGRQPS